MANTSILAAFERMWQHIVIALGDKADKTEIVQSDWSQADETAADYIKNRTHYDATVTQEHTFTFDGDLDGKEYVNIFSGLDMVKVSDETPSTDEIIGATISIFDCGDIYQYEIIEDMIATENAEINFVGYSIHIRGNSLNMAVVLEDTTEMSKGIWFAHQCPEGQVIYPAELSCSITTGELKKIDTKYIPFPDADDAFELVAEMEMAAPLMAVDNTIYTTPDGVIYTL